MDHIGALDLFLKEFPIPIYTTRLTRGLIEVKLKQEHMLDEAVIHTIAAGDVLELPPFTIEPFHVCHSIPDTVGLGITTPAGLIVHSGDYKLDPTPTDGRPTDIAKLAEFSARGVLALLADSTNADQPGMTPSEAVLDDVLRRITREARGRVIIATFASLISRIQQAVDVAAQLGRKLAIAGRAMVENTKMARDLGYLTIPDGMLLSLEQIGQIPADEVMILATGAQGEPMGMLSRLATGRHSSLRIQEGDTVVISSHTIPGNEEVIHAVINKLYQRGADVYYDPVAPVHVSGHASQEEQKLLLNIVRPRFFVPIHGELRHLKQHGKLAREVGVAEKDIAVIENGYQLYFTQDGMEIGKRIPGGHVFVEGSMVGETGPQVLEERDALAQNGFVQVVVRYNQQTGQLIGSPHFVSRGFVPDFEDFLSDAERALSRGVRVTAGTDPATVQKLVERTLSGHIYDETRRKPVVISTVIV